MRTDSPLDVKVKRYLVEAIMKKLCLSVDRRRHYKMERKAKLNDNMLNFNNFMDKKEPVAGGKLFAEDAYK